jgi:hypothetical protein
MASDAGVPQEFLHSCYSTQRIPHWTPEKGVCSTNPFEGGAAEREKKIDKETDYDNGIARANVRNQLKLSCLAS